MVSDYHILKNVKFQIRMLLNFLHNITRESRKTSLVVFLIFCFSRFFVFCFCFFVFIQLNLTNSKVTS